jgi:hypothetical protein
LAWVSEGKLRIEGARNHRLETVASGIYQIDLRKSEEVVLRPEE